MTTPLIPLSNENDWDYYLNKNGSIYSALQSYNTSNEVDASQENGGFPGAKIVAHSIQADQITVGTFIQVGGAAGDVNAGVTTINGGQITTNTITADKINVSTLSAINANLGTITAGTINGVTIQLPNETLGTGTSGKLIWASNARIWGDSSGKIGINGVGGEVIVYANSNEIADFIDGSQANFHTGINISDGNFNVIKDSRFTGELILDQDHFQFGTGGAGSGGFGVFTIRNFGVTISHTGSSQAEIKFGTNTFLRINDGTTKTAVVPTKDGYRALYAMESPDVWFMDFCPGRKIRRKWWKFWDTIWEATLDPMFIEVSQPPFVIVPTAVKGLVQVWAKRKGHPERFEEKTEADFQQNEAFLKSAKVK